MADRHNDNHPINDEVEEPILMKVEFQQFHEKRQQVMCDLQQAVAAFLAKNLTMMAMNVTTRMCVNLLFMVIKIEIGLQPMTKMTVKMMSMKKTFTEDIVVLLRKVLMIIRSIV